MTSPIKNRLFCTALLLSSLQFGFAQALTNTFFFGPPLTPVWDLSGTYQITNRTQGSKLGPMDLVFNDLTLGLDPRGRLQGANWILVPFGDATLGGYYKLSGSVTGGGTKTRVKFSIKFNGNGNVAGVDTLCNISVKYNLEVNPSDLTLVGTSTGSAHFSGLGSSTLNSYISLPLPLGVDGGWDVILDAYPFGTKLSGTAVVQADNFYGNPLATKVSGNLPAQSATAKLKLSGYGYSAGTQLNMQFIPVVGATNLAAAINGKVLGQKVKN
jgi:hypothetical protein